MNLYEGLLSRRSIRKYSQKTITDKLIDKILEAGMYAPSAVNKQPWHFIVFRQKNTVNEIINVHPNASMLKNANVGILICYDENLQHDQGYGPVDCSACTQNILLAAHSLGIGSCWVGIYPREARMEAMHKLFGLPEHIKAFSIVSLGYPDESKSQPKRFKSERIHKEKW